MSSLSFGFAGVLSRAASTAFALAGRPLWDAAMGCWSNGSASAGVATPVSKAAPAVMTRSASRLRE
jgi:hypothetical protein